MFDFDAGKLLILGVVALVVIGPKELPGVMRQVGQAVSKLRRMAAEFQSQFMEAMREAELDDLKKELASVQEAAKIDVDFNPVEDVKREMTAAITPPAADPGTSAVVPTGPFGTVAAAPELPTPPVAEARSDAGPLPATLDVPREVAIGPPNAAVAPLLPASPPVSTGEPIVPAQPGDQADAAGGTGRKSRKRAEDRRADGAESTEAAPPSGTADSASAKRKRTTKKSIGEADSSDAVAPETSQTRPRRKSGAS
jgi:sec-independent protein translocase protein TatB